MKKIFFKKIFLLFLSTIIFSHCGKQSNQNPYSSKFENQTKSFKSTNNLQYPELDFEVQNKTEKTVYVVCFSHIQKEPFTRWRWDKSPVYKLKNNDSVFINIDTIPDDENRKQVFAYLAVFKNEQIANESIYELVDDKKKIDLDKIYELKNKKVILKVERYGFKKEQVDFEIIKKLKKKHLPSELDFVIENRTGKTIFVTGFIYQNKDNIRTVWKYDKTPVQKLEPGQISIIDVDTVGDSRNRIYMSGFLGIFEEHEEKKAQDATYELLQPKNRIALGRISRLKNKKIILDIDQYGSVGEISEFDIQPVGHVLSRLQPITKQTQQKNKVDKEEPEKKILKIDKQKKQQSNKKYKLFL